MAVAGLGQNRDDFTITRVTLVSSDTNVRVCRACVGLRSIRLGKMWIYEELTNKLFILIYCSCICA